MVTMAGNSVRAERANTTRERILTAAERLFAEHGVFAVSNRQVGETAGQGNNTAVSYHFGTKVDLVHAIVRRHAEEIDRLRLRMLTEIGESTDVRDWVACMVRPPTEHLATLDSPSWFARFAAQIMTDPTLRPIMEQESLRASSLRQTLAGLNRCLPDLPAEVRAERDDMARQLMVQMPAERERALAEDVPTPRASWDDAATGLIDAIVGLFAAPVVTRQSVSGRNEQ